MAFIKVDLLLIFLYISSSHAFTVNTNGNKQELVNNEIRPDLDHVVEQQANTQLNIQLHVGDEENGLLTVRDMIIQLGGRYDAKDREDRVRLPGHDAAFSKCTSGDRHLHILSGGEFINMQGLQHIDCEKACWEMIWKRDRHAGTINFAFDLPQSYSRNEAVLPKGNTWLAFPVWTSEGLKEGQQAKKDLLAEIEHYDRKWNEELDKCEMTDNPIMKMFHEGLAHAYATKCDDLYDYSLDNIPDDEQCCHLQKGLLLSNQGWIWRKDGKDDKLLGHAVASVSSKELSLSSFSSGSLRP